jgi:glycosyltransferase involved in cell wall biosynthesis
MPAITAIIPVLNRAHIVDQAIASALSQELPPGCVMNVMVVDDGSSDDLAATLRPFGLRITCLRHDRNMGAAAARNTGIAAAVGDYVAFLDSDDVWLPGKIQAQIAFMQERGYQASCTAYVLTRPGMQRIVSPTYETGTLGLSDLTWVCFVSPGSTLVCARDAFRQIGDFDTKLQRLEDWDWLLRYVSTHDLGFLAMPLASIEVGPNRDASKVLNALDRIKSSHATRFSPHQSRQFRAALEIERAAAHFRSGHSFAALPALITSLLLVPIGNRALAAVLHNRLRRG